MTATWSSCCRLLFAVILIWQTVFQLSGCSASTREASLSIPEAVPVNVVQVQRKKFSRPVTSPGTVVCIDKRNIPCRTEGVLLEIEVMPGQTVTRGDVVARMDSAFLELEYERLKNQADRMRNALMKSRQDRRLELQNAEIRLIEIDRLELRLRKAERQLEQTQKDYNTETELHATGSISAAGLTEYRNRLLDARESVQDLKHQLAELNIGLRDIDFSRAGHDLPSCGTERGEYYLQLQESAAGSQVAAAEIDLKAAELELDRMREMISLCTIRSPDSGVISSVHTMEGEYLSIGSSVCTLMNPAGLFVRFELAESQAGAIRTGTAVRIAGPNLDSELKGSVAHIYPEVDPRSRSISLLCSIEDTPEELGPGMFVSVSIRDRTEKLMLVLPKSCLKADSVPEQARFFLVKDGKAFEHALRPAAASGEEVFFAGGLNNGDPVVLHPPSTLRDGFPVLLLDAAIQGGKE
ncbi:MAG: efflux RND transporter periplasmic adaptor subunit [Sediminispirochaetaceae bacterium]